MADVVLDFSSAWQKRHPGHEPYGGSDRPIVVQEHRIRVDTQDDLVRVLIDRPGLATIAVPLHGVHAVALANLLLRQADAVLLAGAV